MSRWANFDRSASRSIAVIDRCLSGNCGHHSQSPGTPVCATGSHSGQIRPLGEARPPHLTVGPVAPTRDTLPRRALREVGLPMPRLKRDRLFFLYRPESCPTPAPGYGRMEAKMDSRLMSVPAFAACLPSAAIGRNLPYGPDACKPAQGWRTMARGSGPVPARGRDCLATPTAR